MIDRALQIESDRERKTETIGPNQNNWAQSKQLGPIIAGQIVWNKL